MGKIFPYFLLPFCVLYDADLAGMMMGILVNFLLLLIIVGLIILSVIDCRDGVVEYKILAMVAIFLLLWRFCLTSASWVEIMMNVCTLALLALVLRYGCVVIRRGVGMGLGDVAMFGVCGIVVTFAAWPLFLCFVGVSGIVIACYWHLIRKKGGRFPFVPALSLGLASVLLMQFYEMAY